MGNATVTALKNAGHSVLVTCRNARASSLIYAADLLNETERVSLLKEANADVIVHLAWQTDPGNFWDSPENSDWVTASYDLINRFFDSGGKRAILAGSCAEYDWSIAERPLKENSPCRPASIYGSCKLDLYRRCEQLTTEGASIAWGRLFFLMGPREHPSRFVPTILLRLLAGETAKMSHGRQIRDFLHVDDAGRAFATLVDSPIDGIVNIASGVGASLAKLAETAQCLIGLGNVDLGALPPHSPDPPKLIADIRRLRIETDFEPCFNWSSALDTCVNYWQNEMA